MQSPPNLNATVNDLAEQNEVAGKKWVIDQYQQQHSMQNSTKNYVCAPQHSLEALYVEQFRKMQQRGDTLASVPVAESNRFDVSNQLKLPDEETQSLEELVQAFRLRKFQRVAALRNHQIISEKSFSTRARSSFRRLRNTVIGRIRDTIAEFQFALRQFTLYWHN